MAISRERLADLLIDPREDLNFEVKNWLDLQNSNDDKATFAKAVLALANHGGGFIVLGMAETDVGVLEAPGRPPTRDGYSQDLINGIAQRYCDPPFHLAVHLVSNPAGAVFPIAVVPGGHRVPVRARRAGPNGNTIQDNAIYVRKPGPRSEVPQSVKDWDDLLDRCLQNRRDEMFDRIRDLLTGVVPQVEKAVEPARLDQWIKSSRERWEQLIATLAPGIGATMPHGRVSIGYEIIGEPRKIAPAGLPEVLIVSVVRNTGWPPFWYPTREGISPYPFDGAVECWIGGDPMTPVEKRDAAHSDFWRIRADGLAYLIRGYQEDVMETRSPATGFDITLPVWRIGEALLHARSLAKNLFDGATTIKFAVTYEGLAGRSLISVTNRHDYLDDKIARQDAISLFTHIDAEAIDTNLPEIIHPLLSPLYALFDFFELPMQLVVEELASMRATKF